MSRTRPALPGRCRPLVLAAVAGLLPLAGCKDQAAVDRAAAEETVSELGTEMRGLAARVAADGDVDAYRTALEGIARRASSINGATDVQQAAGAMIAANAHQQAGELELAVLAAREVDHAVTRSAAEIELTAAARIAAIASSLRTTDSNAARDVVNDAIAAARDAGDQADSQLAALAGPIAERRSANADDRAQADRLNRQANDLRREAVAAGFRAGLPQYEQAIELERQADGYELQVAGRENELSYQLEPEYALSQVQVDSAQQAIGRLQETLTGLTARDRSLADAASALLDQVSTWRSSIGQAMSSASPDGNAAAFDRAIQHAETAIQQAESAARKDRQGVGNSAPGATARARILLAQIHMLRAQARSRHAALYDQAARIPSLGIDGAARNASELRSAADADRTAAAAALDAARTDATGANLGTLAATIDDIRSRLDG